MPTAKSASSLNLATSLRLAKTHSPGPPSPATKPSSPRDPLLPVPLPLHRNTHSSRHRGRLGLHLPTPASPPPPTIPVDQTVSVVSALGADRTMIQCVVYRTKRTKIPSPSRSDDNNDTDIPKDESSLLRTLRATAPHVRDRELFSLPEANTRAAALVDKYKKGVVGKR